MGSGVVMVANNDLPSSGCAKRGISYSDHSIFNNNYTCPSTPASSEAPLAALSPTVRSPVLPCMAGAVLG